jgi:type IV pilus assembly protein PilY1
VNPNDWEVSKVIDNIGPVTSSVVRLQNNTIPPTNWLFFGSGRYYYALNNDKDDPTAQKRLYGIKEPCFGLGGSTTISSSCTTTVLESALTDVDTTFPAPDVANAALFKGWYIPLDSSTTAIAYDNTGAQSYQAERVITDPLATTAGVVLFTTLRPYNADCAIGGRTFLWAVQYNTGGIPSAYALQGKALMQVSTASVEQLDLGSAFSKSVSGADASLHRGGRRSYAMDGVPPTAQGLSLQVPPPPVKRILHMKER